MTRTQASQDALQEAPKRKVMILAAGRGKRLRPLTDKMPKPLVTIQGKSLIEHHLQKLTDCEVVINHAWLGQQIEEALGDGSAYQVHITYSPEPEGGLETAGGILHALANLTDGKSPFLVVNGDVFSDFDLNALRLKPLKKDCLGHLILVPSPSFKDTGDFGLSEEGLVLQEGDLTFAGISLLHPDLFKNQAGGFVPLAPILREAIHQGSLTGEVYHGAWNDIGTLERLEEARQKA